MGRPVHLRWFTKTDLELARSIVGSWDRLDEPDLIIAPDGDPYLYRWHVISRNNHANVYFHIQTASDPERPLHDHPWDNSSTILAGGYYEEYNTTPGQLWPVLRNLKKGDTVFRRAEEAHRLILPQEIPYTMTLFTTGAKRRDWGFWYPEGWVSNKEVCIVVGNTSVHKDR